MNSSRVRIKDLWNEQRIFNTRTLAAVVIIFTLSFSLAARLVWLQVVRYDYYLEQSQGNRVRLDPIPASRGLILDRNGTVLADNEPGYQLELVREATPDLDATLAGLMKLGLVGADELDETRRMIMSRRSFDHVPIRLRMTDDEIGRFALHQYEFPGVELRTRQTRHYPFGELGVHALGYVSSISEQDLEHIDRAAYAGTTLIGKSGVEASYEDDLHGRNGYREILVNAQGRSVQKVGAYEQDLKSSPPEAGEDLVLSIDLAAQQAAENGLGANRGAVVAIDPRTGDVLALASHPGFDPSLFARGLTRAEYAELTDNPAKPLLNRALRGTYPSGSTIKPVIALAGLTYNIVDPDKREFCSGEFHLPGSAHLYREGKGGRHGYVDLQDAIAKSCDVYFYSLSSRIGVDKIDQFLAPFGYGALTGIDIDGEKPGILPSPEWKKKAYKRPQDQVWYPGETVNFGVGQGYLLITPLQLAHIVSVLAGRGENFRPRLVTGVRDFTGAVKEMAPVQNPSVTGVSDANWNIVVKGMIGAFAYGTAAASGKNQVYTMAGKTGTAQVFSVAQGQKYDEKKAIALGLRDHALFIAFAPVDHPRIAVAVLAENAGFGASVAAPIARKVMDAFLLDKDGQLKPDEAAGEPAVPAKPAPTPAPAPVPAAAPATAAAASATPPTAATRPAAAAARAARAAP